MNRTALFTGLFLAACSGATADGIGFIMEEAGAALGEAGTYTRSAVGDSDAEATFHHHHDEAGPAMAVEREASTQDAAAEASTPPVVAPDAGPVVEPEGPTTLLKASSTCGGDNDSMARATLDPPDPNGNTIIVEKWYAVFDVPGLDPADPPFIQAYDCDKEYFDDFADPFADLVACPDGFGCVSQRPGAPPSAGACSASANFRMTTDQIWVTCGNRTHYVNPAGTTVGGVGQRAGVVRLVIEWP